jgi:N-methylhydantoinase B
MLDTEKDVSPQSLKSPDMDPVTFEVLRNALINVAEEMALTVRRAAYSTNIKTRADFSCAYFDDQLRCIAQSFAQPAHLVSMAAITPVAVREYGIEKFEAGDALLVNDPHRGASHLNDITCIAPVFVEGKLVGFVANMAHHVDVGGSSPASLGINREIYQEGIMIPPMRIAKNGEIDENVLAFLLSNVRARRETSGDLRAQLSANFVGAKRIVELCKRYPTEFLRHFCNELVAYTERWTARDLSLLPNGTYEAETFRDDDGFTDEPIRLNAKVTIADGRINLDVSGSSPQRASPLNCTRAMATCALAFVAKSLVSPGISLNSGFLSRLSVTGPDGLICTAVRPAAVVGGWETGQKLTELILLALHRALPSIIPASGKALIVNLGFGGQDPKRNEYYCYMETIGGGGGGRFTKDGASAVQTNLHNTENAPIEEVELNYPIRISRYELIQNSCGAGKFRGGLGIRRDFEFPFADCSFTILSDGRKFAPWGLGGGLSGACARFIFDPEGEKRELPSKITLTVEKGGCVSVQTPGGGGMGEPASRDRSQVIRDLRNGYISSAVAADVYGVDAGESVVGHAKPTG